MFTVSLIRADGYIFNNAFATLQDAREFVAKTSLVLLPGERVELKAA